MIREMRIDQTVLYMIVPCFPPCLPRTPLSSPCSPLEATEPIHQSSSWLRIAGKIERTPPFKTQNIQTWWVVWNMFVLLLSIGNHHPNWLTHFLHRGWLKPPTRHSACGEIPIDQRGVPRLDHGFYDDSMPSCLIFLSERYLDRKIKSC